MARSIICILYCPATASPDSAALSSLLSTQDSALRTSLTRHSALFLEFEHLQPIVSRVHRDDAIMLVHGDAPRVGELAGVVPAAAPKLDPAARVLVDHLHAIVAELAHDEVPFAVHVQAIRIPELAK